MNLHVFFDTTEMMGDKTCRPRLGRISNPKLRKAADAINATLYVPSLVVDEVAYRRWRRLGARIKDLEEALTEIGPYVESRVGTPPEEGQTLALFRKEIEDALREVRVVLVPSTGIELADVLHLSTRRVPPFGKADDPTGFHDAVILLSVIKYASTHHLPEIMFVSADTDHQGWAVKRIAKDRGVDCELVPAIDVLIDKMESLAAAHLKSMHDFTVKIATDFVNAQLSDIQSFVNIHLPTIGQFVDYKPPVTEVLGVRAREAEAIPISPPTKDQEGRLSLFVKGIAEVVQQEFHFPQREHESEFRWSRIGYDAVKASQIYLSTGRPVTISRKELEVQFAGEATARFDGTRFVRPLHMLSLAFRPQPPDDSGTFTFSSTST